MLEFIHPYYPMVHHGAILNRGDSTIVCGVHPVKRSIQKLVVVGLAALVFIAESRAQAPDDAGLEKVKDGYRHKPTKLEFFPTEGWDVSKPRALPDGVSLALETKNP